ncbi:(Fe-S)-binding protein [bacterium]|nr:(Fe-S)-binding protein [bacterium]
MALRLLSIHLYLAADRTWRGVHRAVFFWRRQRGVEAFLARYKADQVVAVSEQERLQSTDLEKCQVCSLCTPTCTAVQAGTAPASFEPKMLLSVFARHSHDSEVFLEEWLACSECNACTVECPTGVPVHAAVDLVLDRRAQVGFRRGTQREKV